MDETRNDSELGNEIINTQQSIQRDSQNPASNLEVPSEIPDKEDTDSPNHVSKLKSRLNSSSSHLNLR